LRLSGNTFALLRGAFVDGTLNMSGPGKGNADDEFNIQMRETARFMAMQTLDEIARMLRHPQAKGK